MMERIAKLVSASAAVRRKIWASLPFGVRFAEFLVRLASSSTDAFGKVMYGEFIQRGIIGLPDVHGKPVAELPVKNITNRLPPGYGRDFGSKAFKILMGKYHNPQMVDDLMSDFLLRFLEKGSKHLVAGSTLKDAENYVLRGLQNDALNWLRKKRETSDMLPHDTGDSNEPRSIYEVTPAFDEDSAEKLFDERMLPAVRVKLRQIHPDAEQYVKLSILDGYTDREILGDPANGVPSLLEHPYGGGGAPLNEKLWGHYKKKIYDVLKHGFEDLQEKAHHHHAV